MIVTMSQTVGELTNANTYQVRAKTGEKLIAATQATKASTKGAAAAVPVSKTGKSDR